MANSDLNDWYNSLPKVFRIVFTALVLGPLILRFNLVDPRLLLADYEKVYKSFQLWRVLTPCLIAKVSFPWAIKLYIFYNYGKLLSETTFTGRPADEAFMYTVLVLAANCVGWFFGEVVYYGILTNSVIYVWASCNREVTAQFYFGIKIKAAYLPWALAAWDFLLNNSPVGFYGIVAGHVYFFLKYKWPVDFGGRDFLETPQFYKNMFPEFRNVAGRNVSFRRPGDNTSHRGGDGHNWGSGQRLGD